MLKRSLLPTCAILLTGGLLGYLAAKVELPPMVQAAPSTPVVASKTTEDGEISTMGQAEKAATETCCSQALGRSDQVALASHHQLVAATLGQAGKKPNILVIFG